MGRKSKNYSDRESEQGRCFEAIIYPDSEEYDCDIILNRLFYYWDKAFWKLHDKDTYSELEVDEWKANHKSEECPFNVGDKKKAHWHIIGYCGSPMLLGRAASKFGIPSNYVQKVKNQKRSVQYLIHLNNPEKYQYESSEIHTFNVDDSELKKYLRGDTDSMDKAKLLFDFISGQDYVSMETLINFSFESGTWDELRRGQHIFTTLIKEKASVNNASSRYS